MYILSESSALLLKSTGLMYICHQVLSLPVFTDILEINLITGLVNKHLTSRTIKLTYFSQFFGHFTSSVYCDFCDFFTGHDPISRLTHDHIEASVDSENLALAGVQAGADFSIRTLSF
jgi:hypothetical protein